MSAGTMLPEVAFFYEHAGWGYDPKTETPDQGRERSAIALAAAEQVARMNGWEYVWEDDWDGDHSYLEQDSFQGYEITTCELCTLRGDDGEILASLGCIDDATSEYRRVVEAELASEAIG